MYPKRRKEQKMKTYKITQTTETFTLTASGKSWRSKPDTVETEEITMENYRNYINSVPFFNGFCGGTCRAYYSHTFLGYTPTRVTTISPGREVKKVANFRFSLA